MNARRVAPVLIAGTAVLTVVVLTLFMRGEPGAHFANGFATEAGVSPASLNGRRTVSISASITSDVAMIALIDIEVHGPGGLVYQRAYDDQELGRRVPSHYTVEWRPPADLAPGAYRVKLGVFTPGWGELLHWNDHAAFITLPRDAR
jgi:hypothetical protein